MRRRWKRSEQQWWLRKLGWTACGWWTRWPHCCKIKAASNAWAKRQGVCRIPMQPARLLPLRRELLCWPASIFDPHSMFAKLQRVHFVGIGGIGMSGIAEVLLNLGYPISGSDLKGNALTMRLARLGASIQEGHSAENVHGADVVVTSAAIAANNPEVLEAQQLKIPVIPRAEMLAELMRLKYGIA